MSLETLHINTPFIVNCSSSLLLITVTDSAVPSVEVTFAAKISIWYDVKYTNISILSFYYEMIIMIYYCVFQKVKQYTFSSSFSIYIHIYIRIVQYGIYVIICNICKNNQEITSTCHQILKYNNTNLKKNQFMKCSD